MHYIYQFLNDKSDVIYVGITNRLQKRLRSEHFTDAGHLSEQCYEEVESILYSECSSHDDARIKERYLINRLNPKYNTSMKNESIFNYVIDDFQWVDFGFKRPKLAEPHVPPTEDDELSSRFKSVSISLKRSPIVSTLFMKYDPASAQQEIERIFGELYKYTDEPVLDSVEKIDAAFKNFINQRKSGV